MRLAAFVFVSVLLLVADGHFGVLAPARTIMADVVVPVHWLSSAPGRVFEWLRETLVIRETLLEENRALRAEALVLRARNQRLAAITAENVRLRELLNSTAVRDEHVLVAEIIGVSPDLASQTVVIDKGSRQGLQPGQAVIDAYGLFGQVIEVSQFSSRVLLVTDAMHALPAQVVRNGARVIVEGDGRIDMLNVNHVASTMDVRPGDLLVTSELEQRFPGGYPVGVVESVVNDPGKPFAVVQARPSAQLDRSRHVLVVIGMVSPAVEKPVQAAPAELAGALAPEKQGVPR